MELFANFQLKTAALDISRTDKIFVFPNPSTGQFTIKQNKYKTGTYVLISLIGTELKRGSFERETDIHMEG